MVSNRGFRAPLFLFANIIIISLLIWTLSLSHAAESDIDCLRAVKASLRDPNNYLASWDFTNGAQTSICKFVGIGCWHYDDNSVINIELSGMGLEGEFPLGVVNCTKMTGLNLSNNNLSGPIPKNISSLIRFVTRLDLSYNQFRRKIPENLANCSYLSTLELNNNNLTGPIPPQIFKIPRLETFNYANNSGLCGGPTLPQCHKN